MAEAARIRDYRSSDADEVNRLAVTAFEQFRDAFDDWPAMRAGLSKTSELSSGGEIIVAELGNRLTGSVGYFGPGVKKAAFFDQAWPIIRMLVVGPGRQGQGTRACVDIGMPRQGAARPVPDHCASHEPHHDGRLADVSQDGLQQGA